MCVCVCVCDPHGQKVTERLFTKDAMVCGKFVQIFCDGGCGMTEGRGANECRRMFTHQPYTCCNCWWDGEGERDTFAEEACGPCQIRKKQWGGATTQSKFDASPFFQETAREAAEAEAKRKTACKYTAFFGRCNNDFCRKAKSDHYGPHHLCLDPEELKRKQKKAAKQQAAAEAKAKAEAEEKRKQE